MTTNKTCQIVISNEAAHIGDRIYRLAWTASARGEDTESVCELLSREWAKHIDTDKDGEPVTADDLYVFILSTYMKMGLRGVITAMCLMFNVKTE